MNKLKYIYNNLSLTYGIFIILIYFVWLIANDSFPFGEYGTIESCGVVYDDITYSIKPALTFTLFFIGMLLLEDKHNFCFKNKFTNNFIYKTFALIIISIFLIRIFITLFGPLLRQFLGAILL